MRLATVATMAAIAAATQASAQSPAYEVQGFPITQHQAQVLTPNDMRERTSTAVPDKTAIAHAADITAALALLPTDHPQGSHATVTLTSVTRAVQLRDPTLSSFIVDFAPGALAVLHRSPSPGYVLVHVLSGALRAKAWDAWVGSYRAGETWAEPAFAHDISAKNASATQSARAVVTLITGEIGPPETGDE